MADWISFFDSDHPIYVNPRHRAVHAGIVGDALLSYLPEGAAMLDYGCGEARYAERLATAAGEILLCEAAPQLREKLAARHAGDTKIRVLAPQALADRPEASVDLVVMLSVAQYLTPAELDTLLAQFRRLLRPGGKLLLGDVICPQTSAAADAFALLRLAARNGFFLAALGGLLRTMLSGYLRLRRGGLTRYDEAAMLRKLQAAGFSPVRAPQNIGHIQARMTFVATPA